jgi:3-phenylpropionate/trans-cinnamate dioxygenase ferredoxin reductase subunit
MIAPKDVVIVGASLAGLRAAEALRDGGYDGRLTLIGEEPHPPYDRPPLSKQVLNGWVAAHETELPRLTPLAANWRLGVRAVGLDRGVRRIKLANGAWLGFDRLVVATGTRARRWFVPEEAALKGVHLLRTRDDAAALVTDLDAARRVLVIGAGFTGCEVASACRDRGLAVIVVEIAAMPLLAALGSLVAGHAEQLQRRAGVDLRCGQTVTELIGDKAGRVIGARLASGEEIAADVVVVCLGAVRNTEWLEGVGLDIGRGGLACDQQCRALQTDGAVAEDIFVCGDVSRFRHPLAGETMIALEHWGNAVDQAAVAAANLLAPGSATNDAALPRFWSMQFGSNFKSAGLPPMADQAMIVQGAQADGRFIVAYGRRGRMVGVVAVNQAQWLPFYEQQIAAGGAFPPDYRVVDQPAGAVPEPAGFLIPSPQDTPTPSLAPA